MRRMMMAVCSVCAALLALGPGAAAQVPTTPAGWIWLGFSAAEPQGDLARYFEHGWGGHFGGALPVAAEGFVRLRADFGVLVYGSENRDLCFPPPVGCRIGLDLSTTNNIIHGAFGPELVIPAGPVEPYVHGAVGFSYFVTTSSLGGDQAYENIATTTNFSDGSLAWTAGGGLRVRLRGGDKPIFMDFGAEYHENGVMEFLTEGGIVDRPDGSIALFPHRSDADLLVFGLGFSFGIPHRGAASNRY